MRRSDYVFTRLTHHGLCAFGDNNDDDVGDGVDEDDGDDDDHVDEDDDDDDDVDDDNDNDDDGDDDGDDDDDEKKSTIEPKLFQTFYQNILFLIFLFHLL